mmetsp:Transcript_37280/g.100901  ORF Transcript_37280/g.100901 Transcript_37280/m.100901 type:complete len:250 (+) Transcript_37280:163-912(+)
MPPPSAIAASMDAAIAATGTSPSTGSLEAASDSPNEVSVGSLSAMLLVTYPSGPSFVSMEEVIAAFIAAFSVSFFFFSVSSSTFFSPITSTTAPFSLSLSAFLRISIRIPSTSCFGYPRPLSTAPPNGRFMSSASSGRTGTTAITSSVDSRRFWWFSSTARARMGTLGYMRLSATTTVLAVWISLIVVMTILAAPMSKFFRTSGRLTSPKKTGRSRLRASIAFCGFTSKTMYRINFRSSTSHTTRPMRP